ncbi:hypothetical protein CONCODRAFT_80557 [Conidiobolus coronatus NRRL 28638]|uniref:Uncharacterized protein n=1 Tax=Conidiobolus coronatus (strain ATCC 28846 / CBS 209.66 / NRRL 28638) TaxID=796925 RepID=A0A137NUD6_CONC2|nr:hypothetical protein CONCODRAFT_80557 [Conidiobolus coronatus NRRL 28638]|eukprot:KXN66214.1 hypothetical protein CONCODRAFT_80557 [Conidiobolus coronatus NRRL 28638]
MAPTVLTTKSSDSSNGTLELTLPHLGIHTLKKCRLTCDSWDSSVLPYLLQETSMLRIDYRVLNAEVESSSNNNGVKRKAAELDEN